MLEYRIAARRNAQTGQAFGQFVQRAHGHAGDIVEAVLIAGRRGGADAIGGTADLSGDVADMRVETLPLGGNAAHFGEAVILADAGNEHGADIAERWLGKVDGGNIRHSNGLHEREVIETAPGAHLLRRQADEVAKGAGESFVRAVAGVERDRQDVGSAVRPARAPLRSGAWRADR